MELAIQSDTGSSWTGYVEQHVLGTCNRATRPPAFEFENMICDLFGDND